MHKITFQLKKEAKQEVFAAKNEKKKNKYVESNLLVIFHIAIQVQAENKNITEEKCICDDDKLVLIEAGKKAWEKHHVKLLDRWQRSQFTK